MSKLMLNGLQLQCVYISLRLGKGGGAMPLCIVIGNLELWL